jgi:UDP-2,4-diacetamido-2,4,6-trideoxy-beta-L-altropyranose hydrolase
MNLIFRADASAALGIGHVMRCLAIAQSWQDGGGRAFLVSSGASAGLRERLRSEGVGLIMLSAPPGTEADALETARVARECRSPWVVADGYSFDGAYQQRIRDEGIRVFLIDDMGSKSRVHADVVMNQNLHAEENLYPLREPETRLLLGTRFVVLRRDFLAHRPKGRSRRASPRTCLITLGGGDVHNASSLLARAVLDHGPRDLHLRVLVGVLNPHLKALEALASGPSCEVISNVKDMPELMSWADFALTAAGSTSWELAYMGVPFLAVVLADNQRPIAESLERAGAALNLGEYRDLSVEIVARRLREVIGSSDVREDLAARSSALVDGEGNRRVLGELMSAYEA